MNSMELNAGIRDLCDSKYDYIEPYDGGHTPLPAASRAVYVNLACKF